jgi:transcriptional regulator with XRE-family HTH domain
MGNNLGVISMQWILNDIPLGRNIQNIRINRNMTQEELTTRLQLIGINMSRSTLANIEVGRRNIKARDLKAIKEILNTDYDEFFDGIKTKED